MEYGTEPLTKYIHLGIPPKIIYNIDIDLIADSDFKADLIIMYCHLKRHENRIVI